MCVQVRRKKDVVHGAGPSAIDISFSAALDDQAWEAWGGLEGIGEEGATHVVSKLVAASSVSIARR